MYVPAVGSILFKRYRFPILILCIIWAWWIFISRRLSGSSLRGIKVMVMDIIYVLCALLLQYHTGVLWLERKRLARVSCTSHHTFDSSLALYLPNRNTQGLLSEGVRGVRISTRSFTDIFKIKNFQNSESQKVGFGLG